LIHKSYEPQDKKIDPAVNPRVWKAISLKFLEEIADLNDTEATKGLLIFDQAGFDDSSFWESVSTSVV